MFESRRHYRIKEILPLQWKIEESGTEGQGQVRNISVSGMLLETDEAFKPAASEECHFQLKCLAPEAENFVPFQSRLVWLKKISFPKVRYLCGLEFVNPSEQFIGRIQKQVEQEQEKMAQAANVNILGNYNL